MLDIAAGPFDPDGDHVAPVGDGRGAEDHHEVDIGHGGERPRHGLGLVRHANLRDDGGAGGSKALCEVAKRLLHRRGFQSRQHCRDHRDTAKPVGRDA